MLQLWIVCMVGGEIWKVCDLCWMRAGVLAARAASTVTGRSSDDTGIRIESIIKAGLTGPMAEALAMYYQVSNTYLEEAFI